ncbi:M28 family metallopeptidase [Sphingopyxis sp. LARHCG72]
MTNKLVLAGALIACLSPIQVSAEDNGAASAARIKADMTFLADDELEGREADTRGYRIAAKYVAAQFEQLGLKPMAADGSFFQSVPMIAYRPASQAPIKLVRKDGSSVDLVFGTEFLPEAVATSGSRKFDAPLVFAGYGIVAPEWKRDDFAGLDLEGKIVVLLSGAPEQGAGDEQAFFGSTSNKRIEAAKRGAVGVMILSTPESEARRPLEKSAPRWQAWRMGWRQPDGKAFDVAPSAPLLANLAAPVGDKLFAGSGMSFESIVARSKTKPIARAQANLQMRAQGSQVSETRDTLSWNVVGKLEGADPDRAVALTAHLDHLGVSESEGAKKIYSGALDNASGVATMIEVARQFREQGVKPRRSLMFVAITAEEKGLIGSDYLANNPLIPPRNIDALVNLDMPILTYDFEDVIAFGAQHSSIGPIVERVAGRMGVKLTPDPMPEESIFTRSDHYRFVQQGVPSIFLMTGFGNGGGEKFKGFLSGCYHQPCDNLAQPIDYRAAAKFAKLNFELTRALADAAEAPRWNPGNLFGTRYGPLHR